MAFAAKLVAATEEYFASGGSGASAGALHDLKQKLAAALSGTDDAGINQGVAILQSALDQDTRYQRHVADKKALELRLAVEELSNLKAQAEELLVAVAAYAKSGDPASWSLEVVRLAWCLKQVIAGDDLAKVRTGVGALEDALGKGASY